MSQKSTYGDNVISLRDVKIVQKNFTVLSNVNLTIKKGKFNYLIGKTGSGKSSLLKVLYGHLPLREGEGEVVGFDLTKLKVSRIPDLRRKLGIIFQDFQLLMDRTVEKNLLFVLEATGWKDRSLMEERIDDVLSSVGMKTKKHKMPHELSGGEQQRVAIARALLNHPELILADEPTGNLDSKAAKDVMKLFKKLNESMNVTIIMVTHDPNIAAYSDKTYIIKDGNIYQEIINRNDDRTYRREILNTMSLLGGDEIDTI